jgi:hypothetical protein
MACPGSLREKPLSASPPSPRAAPRARPRSSPLTSPAILKDRGGEGTEGLEDRGRNTPPILHLVPPLPRRDSLSHERELKRGEPLGEPALSSSKGSGREQGMGWRSRDDSAFLRNPLAGLWAAGRYPASARGSRGKINRRALCSGRRASTQAVATFERSHGNAGWPCIEKGEFKEEIGSHRRPHDAGCRDRVSGRPPEWAWSAQAGG